MAFKKRLLALAVACLMIFSCGPKAVAPQAELDTPEHHAANGNKFLKAGKLEDAFKEFNRARELDPKFAPAHTGMGLVFGFKQDYENAFKSLKAADRYARGKQQELDVRVAYMRVYLSGKQQVDERWLRKVETYYNEAVRIDKNAAAPHFYMGVAYKHAFEFRKAAAQLTKVLDMGRDFAAEADQEYAVIQRIERAMPGTHVGKKIALLDSIDRADIAALFIEELKVDALFRRRAKKTFDTAFKSPDKSFAAGQYVKAPPATDITDHVLKADIDAVIELGIKGLQPFPDHTYRPDQPITRAEFAMMVEDILIKITGDNRLATSFIGNNSPFQDLRSDLPYFNAVMVCTTRGIMEAADKGLGVFNPMGPVSGADALLSLRELKNQIEKF